jgi:hypothetical protein
MCWTLGKQRGDWIHWHDEIYLMDSNTTEATLELIHRVQSHKPGVVIIGDASGKSRRTSAAGETDYTIIHNMLTAANIKFVDLTPTENPLVKDRVNTINARLKSATGDICMTINPKKCPKLKKDLERVTWKPNATAILDKTTDTSLTHASDGVGYAHYVLTPIYGLGSVGRLHILKRG